VSRLLRPTVPPVAVGLAIPAFFIVAESLVVVLLKQVVPGNVFGVVYLLGVLVVSIVWGFGPAAMTSVISAIAFDYFRNRPTNFVATEAENWVALAIFLTIALVAITLAYLARTRAAEADQRRQQADALTELQAALRRVATLVARGATKSEVFSAVAGELVRATGVYTSTLIRYEPDGKCSLLAAHREPGLKEMPVGEWVSFTGENVATMVLRTGRATGRYCESAPESAPCSTAARMREPGLRCRVGAPFVVEGRLWGVAIIGWSRPEPLPTDCDARVGDFADLVAMAIANAETRAELTASRARIVAAGDDARRRIERDLHDGAQQRLVSVGLALRTAEASVPSERHPLKELIADIACGLAGVFEELREISPGFVRRSCPREDWAPCSRRWPAAPPSRSSWICKPIGGCRSPPKWLRTTWSPKLSHQRGQTRTSIAGQRPRRSRRCEPPCVYSRRRNRGSRPSHRVRTHRPHRPR
jgi:signal transduction histidine kinase